MIFDRTNEFSSSQAITASAASTDVIDNGVPQTPQNAANAISRDLGKGRKPEIRVQVVQTFNNLTSLRIDVQVDDNSGFSSPKTVLSNTYQLAELVRGAVLQPEMLPRGVDERFIRLFYTVTGTAPTLGRISAGLVFGSEERDV
jgi:hypothetical protein